MKVNRLGRRLANRLGKAVGRANKQLNSHFVAKGHGIKQAIKSAETQYDQMTRAILQRARAEEIATWGPIPKFRPARRSKEVEVPI